MDLTKGMWDKFVSFTSVGRNTEDYKTGSDQQEFKMKYNYFLKS